MMAATQTDLNERLRHLQRRHSAAPGREPRRSVALAGFGVLEDGTIFEISVVDLSYDGCKVETPEHLLPGMELRVSILGLGGALRAAVQWCKSGRAGLLFKP